MNVMELMRPHPVGRVGASRVTLAHPDDGAARRGEGVVSMRTKFGGRRLVDMPVGGRPPRIY